jgi:plasmid segregation protein ParM
MEEFKMTQSKKGTSTKVVRKREGSYIMGIDVGYSHTKAVTKNKKEVFRSTVREGVIDINHNSLTIDYDGAEFTIGERGRITVSENKVTDPNFEPLLMTAILKLIDERDTHITVNLVTGLPIAWYKKQKDELRDFLYNKRIVVGYKGVDRHIHIKDCLVFPQSAGLPLINPKKFMGEITNLVVDIGGITVDVAQYEGTRIIQSESYQLGMIKFYAKIRTAINSEFNIEVDEQDVERFIEDGFVTVAQEKRDFDFDKHFKAHMDAIMTKIKIDFNINIVSQITFMGGGSLRFTDYIPVKRERSIDCDEIHANAEAFYNVGVQKFG